MPKRVREKSAASSSSTIRGKGRVTLPAEVREALGLEEGDTLLFSVVGDRIEAVPAALVPRDQLWFYTRQWQARIRQAEEDVREGRTRRFTSARQILTHLDQLKK